MKRFEVELHGENFLFNIDGEPKKFGFHARRFVFASDERQAAKIAAVTIHKSPEVRETIMNTRSNPPRIDIVKTVQVGFWKYLWNRRKSRIDFYIEKDSEE